MKATWAILIVTLLTWAVSLFASITMQNTEFILYLATTPFLLATIIFIHKKVQLPIPLLWGLAGLVIFHCLGGLIVLPDDVPTKGKSLLYNMWIIEDMIKYDQIVHAYGNALATWICWHLLRFSISTALKRNIEDIPARPVFLFLCFFAGFGIGGLNEVLEFGAAQTVPDNNVGDYENTGWDLVANTIGGGITVFLIWLKNRNRRMPAAKKK
jgi:hypothetical protein